MKILSVVFVGSLLVSSAFGATTFTTDFIDNADRTNFNGFEGTSCSSLCPTSYNEDGIFVDQINSAPDNIWMAAFLGGFEGSYSWYPNGGDQGYTRITRTGGADFFNVGLLRGSGFNLGVLSIFYELYDDGALVQSGSFSHTTTGQYLGFGGGGFDEIRLWDRTDFSGSGSTDNALAIDSIELSGSSVPEPGTLLLSGLGLATLVFLKRRNAPVRA